MLTVVEEKQGIPLGVLKRGKPRKGDRIFISNVPYRVVRRDRDVVHVKAPKGVTGYHDNPSVTDYAGYQNPEEQGLPKYKSPPIYPGQLGPQPDPRAGYVPFVGGAPLAEAPVPYTPQVFTAYHFRMRIPLFEIESTYIPRVGTYINVGNEQYEYVEVVGNSLLVRPMRTWNHIVVAQDKATGNCLIWVPVSSKGAIYRTKEDIKRYLKANQGLARRAYHLTAVSKERFVRMCFKTFNDNPPKLQRYRQIDVEVR